MGGEIYILLNFAGRHSLLAVNPRLRHAVMRGQPIPSRRNAADSPSRRALRRFLQRSALFGLLVVLLFVADRRVGAVDCRPPIRADRFLAVRQAPSAAHLFGTDEIGRDLLSRVIWGARASLSAGVALVLLALRIRIPLGLLSG